MEEDRRYQSPHLAGTDFGKCLPKVGRKIELGYHRSQRWHVREQRHSHGNTDEKACHGNRRQTPTTKYLCTYIDRPRAIRWRAGLEEPSGHTGLRPLGDIKPRVVWHGKKRFQLLAGSGNALLIKHPHVIPRLLMRAQGGLDLLRVQEMDKTFCLFFLSNSAYVSHILDSWRARTADRARTASGRSLAFLRGHCEQRVAKSLRLVLLGRSVWHDVFQIAVEIAAGGQQQTRVLLERLFIGVERLIKRIKLRILAIRFGIEAGGSRGLPSRSVLVALRAR